MIFDFIVSFGLQPRPYVECYDRDREQRSLAPIQHFLTYRISNGFLVLLSTHADTQGVDISAGPLRASLGPGGTTVTQGLPHSREIAGSLRHCGARGSLPS